MSSPDQANGPGVSLPRTREQPSYDVIRRNGAGRDKDGQLIWSWSEVRLSLSERQSLATRWRLAGRHAMQPTDQPLLRLRRHDD